MKKRYENPDDVPVAVLVPDGGKCFSELCLSPKESVGDEGCPGKGRQKRRQKQKQRPNRNRSPSPRRRLCVCFSVVVVAVSVWDPKKGKVNQGSLTSKGSKAVDAILEAAKVAGAAALTEKPKEKRKLKPTVPV